MSSIRNHVAQRQRLTVHQRQQMLARYHRSPLTQAEFAAQHGIGLSTLGKWLREKGQVPQSAAPVRFQEVMLPSTTSQWAVEVVSPQGWTVRLHTASDFEVISALLPVVSC
jgi:transposase-like protein